ncbi:MAG: PEP-CTERM sorting domain-containing protein [Terracidiphilus sp.]|jgi:hypothetical protein
MRQRLGIIAIVVAAMVAPAALRADDITYAVNESIGATGSVNGTITTDGTVGFLSASNIVGWDLTLNDGTDTATINSADSAVATFGGPGLEGSSTNLSFNYTHAEETGAALIFQESGEDVFYLGAYLPFDGLNTLTISNVGGDEVTLYDNEPSSFVVIANVVPVPEPGTGGLMLIGAGLLGLMMAWRTTISNKNGFLHFRLSSKATE